MDTPEKRALAAELQELQTSAEAAEAKIGDVCRTIKEAVTATLPAPIKQARATLDAMLPAESYAETMTETFVTTEPFSTVLSGLASAAASTIALQKTALPQFAYAAFVPIAGEPEAATGLRREIHALERLIALVDWWKSERTNFADAWTQLVGKKGEDGTFPTNSIEGKLHVLEQALGQARPLDDLAKHLAAASTAVALWAQINEVQKTREAVKDALEPLKALRTLVAAETASSIAALSERINAICARITPHERLVYSEAVVGRKEVEVTGQFTQGMRFNAALVANTSWLRAILWSFIMALREETLDAMGYNPLPLVVLDDPQATFDPRNKRRWAQELVRSANLTDADLFRSQLIVTTHERSFYQMMIVHEKFHAQQGLIGGVNKTSGVATIANGGELQRLYDEAKANNDDAKARAYMRQVRTYCEDLLKFMLRSISNQIPDMTLTQLREELKRLYDAHTPPFDRKPFDSLMGALSPSVKPVQYINEPHHKEDETFGLAEADVVKSYWDNTLLDRIHTAFALVDTFELYMGEPRTFPWFNNVVAFPEGHNDNVKQSAMQQTGVAAAAKTGGRAGDGILTIEEWKEGEKVVLPNHSVYQLAAGTLDPVAGIGDLIIVSNYAKINPRNLVVTVCGSALLARRYNKPENHSEIVVLTGQAVDPQSLSQPVIVQPKNEFRKIVGTLFASHLLTVPPNDADRKFVELPDTTVVEKLLSGARLFKVEGRSAEPIALEGQYLITSHKIVNADAIGPLDGRLVVAIDDAGARYFKRLRVHKRLIVLESLNPDGYTAAVVLALDKTYGLPMLAAAIEVVGVLFELPNAKAT